MSYKNKRIRKPGTIQDLRKRLWQAVNEAERILLTADNDSDKLKAVYALATVAGAYLKVVESAELENRIKQLEKIHELKKAS